MILEVFELNPILDDPRYEGFALTSGPSSLGRESIDDDLTPGFGIAEDNPNWRQPSLIEGWRTPKVVGRVSEFNDYPCVDMVLPAFSDRAVEVLRELLEKNGELLPLKSDTETQYYFYNILTISDALDHSISICDFWCDPPTTATEIEFFAFHREEVSKLSIFRVRELPMSVFVTSKFVNKVEFFGLKGFCFRKVWPLPKGVNWRIMNRPEEANRKQLKKETLVIALPLEKSADRLTSQISQLETAVDLNLQVHCPTDMYYGSYEGHDVLDDAYRMFFSTPNAHLLLGRIQVLVQSYNWPKPVVVHLRKGHIYDADAKEETLTI